ncbi:MAG TPA: PDR/VanB family oxidoreductase [Bordetella sp.]
MASSEPGSLSLRLAGIEYGAEGVNIYRFASVDGAALPGFEPGAHVDVHIGPALMRQYSLLWPAPAPDAYAIAVQVDMAGKGGSRALHHESVVGHRYALSAPRQHFGLAEAGAAGHWLFAGGIGITPIISMYRKLRRAGQPARLHYWAKTPGQMLFFDELRAAGGEVRLFHTEADTRAPRLADILAEVPADAQLYCCGPAGMIDAFDAACARRPAANVHRERFSAALPEDLGPEDAFRVTLRKSGKVLTVQPDETLLGACLAAGVDVSYSCEEGVCGACEVKVLAGAVIHRDSVLSPAAQAQSASMMICCSRGVGSSLELDI